MRGTDELEYTGLYTVFICSGITRGLRNRGL
jgi:hypothetical protein